MDGPPRGVNACLETLEKRRRWVQRRAGGSYDVREAIALGYAIGLLRTADELGLVDQLEAEALKAGRIRGDWIDKPKDESKGAS